MRFSDLFTLLAFALPLVIASPHEHYLRQTELNKRSGADVGLRKRISNARITFYDAGLGACGGTNKNSDFIVALNRPQFGSGSDCYKTITITVNGKSHAATIVDECEGCPFGGLDMSPALFDYFASASAGIIYGDWEFDGGGGGGGGGDSGSPSTKHKSSHSSTHSSTSTTHSTSSAKKAAIVKTHSSTSTTTSSTQTTSTTSINYSAGAASGLAIPTGTVTPGAVNNINGFNQAIIGMGGLIVAGANAN